MLCDSDMREKFVIVVYFKMAPQRENRVNFLCFFMRDTKWEAANLVGVSRTSVYATKKRLDDGEGVNRRAGRGRKTVVDRNSLRDAIRGTASKS